MEGSAGMRGRSRGGRVRGKGATGSWVGLRRSAATPFCGGAGWRLRVLFRGCWNDLVGVMLERKER